MLQDRIASRRITLEDDLEAINEYFYEQQWTDGMPIVPPTPARVERMLAAVDRDPQEAVGNVPPFWAPATIEKIAINAVMAGCRPEYLPVVIAAIEALTDPAYNLFGIQATTNPATPLLIINGPIAKRLEINSGPNVFGQGWRANSTIGRAVRLVLTNVGGGRPGITDKATQGTPGKYSFCVAENEDRSPWEPLHVERGFAREASTVSVSAAGSHVHIGDVSSKSALSFLTMLAHSGRIIGSSNMKRGGEPVYALCPEHADMIAAEGYSKADVKRFLWEHGVVPLSDFPPEYVAHIREERSEVYGDATPETMVSLADRPEDIIVIVTGGPGPHSSLMTVFGKTPTVTRQIRD